MNRPSLFTACLILPWLLQAAPVVWNFDDVATNQLPPRWKAEQTGQSSSDATWQVIEDQTAPSASKVLALSTATANDALYNLCWTDSVVWTNVEITVSFKNVGGTNQNGGLCWRVKDKDNYYAMRASTSEGNFRSYYLSNGTRTQIGTVTMTVSANTWHTLKVVQNGSQMTVWIDDVQQLNNTDTHITGAGGVGCWTKGINQTNWDNFSVTNLDATGIRPCTRIVHTTVRCGHATDMYITLNGRTLSQLITGRLTPSGLVINPRSLGTGKQLILYGR